MIRAAFLLGSNGPEKYDGQRRLEFAVRDCARLMRAISAPGVGFSVTAQGYYSPHAAPDLEFEEELKTLHDLASSLKPGDIIEQFGVLASDQSPEDELLFYFAGHGVISLGKLYFILDISSPRQPATALPWESIKQIIQHSPAQKKIVILDCCHAGEAIDDPLRAAFRGGFDNEVMNAAFRSSNAAILVACGPDGFARETPSWRGGVLTSLIIDALGYQKTKAADDTGEVSLESLRNWMWLEIKSSPEAQAVLKGELPRLYTAGGPTYYLTRSIQGDPPSIRSGRPVFLPQLGEEGGLTELQLETLDEWGVRTYDDLVSWHRSFPSAYSDDADIKQRIERIIRRRGSDLFDRHKAAAHCTPQPATGVAPQSSPHIQCDIK